MKCFNSLTEKKLNETAFLKTETKRSMANLIMLSNLFSHVKGENETGKSRDNIKKRC